MNKITGIISTFQFLETDLKSNKSSELISEILKQVSRPKRDSWMIPMKMNTDASFVFLADLSPLSMPEVSSVSPVQEAVPQ